MSVGAPQYGANSYSDTISHQYSSHCLSEVKASLVCLGNRVTKVEKKIHAIMSHV